MPAFSGLNHGFVIFLLIHFCDLFAAKLAHSFLCLSLHRLVISHCSLSFTWVHEFFHLVRVYLAHFRVSISIGWLKCWIDLIRINHINIIWLLFFLVKWICHLYLVCWSTRSAQMQYGLQFLNLHLGRILRIFVVQNACENLSELRVPFTLHARALKWMLLNLLFIDTICSTVALECLLGFFLNINTLS